MLTAISAPELILLYVWALSAAYIHLRGRERHRFLRQLTDHSTLMAPVNCFMYLFSKVPNRPVLPVAQVPELGMLRDHWQTIRDEALSLYRDGRIKASERYDDIGFNSFFRRGWKRFYLKWYDDYLPSARAACPRTIALLRQVPSINAALFAVLPPGSQLGRHRDPYAGSLRYHLGLATPNSDACRLFLDGEPYSWRDGQDILFDATYIHHAANESDRYRVILFCDVERPMRFRPAAAVNHFFCRHLMRAAETRNAGGEPVGWLNRAFSRIYPLRIRLKRLKKASRGLYYTVKYSALSLVLGLIVFSALSRTL
jgi:beta-hydroxylase